MCKPYFTSLQKIILNWNPKWLEQQIGRSEPPPVYKPWTLRRVEKNFSDWRDHQTTFLPLMMLELWNNISTEYDKWKHDGLTVSLTRLKKIYSKDLKLFKFLIATCRGVTLISKKQVENLC